MIVEQSTYEMANPILQQYGLTPKQAIELFFNQIAHTGKVPLSFDWATTTPNALTQMAMLDAQQGKVERFDSYDELMANLQCE